MDNFVKTAYEAGQAQALLDLGFTKEAIAQYMPHLRNIWQGGKGIAQQAWKGSTPAKEHWQHMRNLREGLGGMRSTWQGTEGLGGFGGLARGAWRGAGNQMRNVQKAFSEPLVKYDINMIPTTDAVRKITG